MRGGRRAIERAVSAAESRHARFGHVLVIVGEERRWWMDTRGTIIQLGLARSLRLAFKALNSRDIIDIGAEQS